MVKATIFPRRKSESPVSKPNIFESITKITSLLLALMAFVGCADLYFYYGLFSVNIFEYIELSEALVHFLETLMALLLYVSLCVLLGIPVGIYASWVNRRMKKQNAAPTAKEDERKSKDKPRVIDVIAMLILLAGPILILIIYFENNFFVRQFLNKGLVMVAIVFAVFGLTYKRVAKTLSVSGKLVLRGVVVVLCILIFGFGRAYSKYEYILENKEKDVVEFDTNGPSVDINHDFYIGRTKNYVFVYNDSLHITNSYPTNIVKKITHNSPK